MQLRSRQGFDARSVKAVAVDDGNGFFYVVRLMPDVAPNRVKIGYANSLESRLAAHRTTCPRLELAQSWPCRRVFEPAAIAAAVNGSATCYGGEVYDVESVEGVVHRLDGFFEMVSL
jgi:hypothetical protein